MAQIRRCCGRSRGSEAARVGGAVANARSFHSLSVCGFDWDSMNRLHEKGFISDPRGKAKSVVFTAGRIEAERLRLFCEDDDGRARKPSEHVYAIILLDRRHRASPIGRELDSLADVISFGVAPAAIAFSAGNNTAVDQWILGFFSICGLSRLARQVPCSLFSPAGRDRGRHRPALARLRSPGA
jgi:Domain of unknown function (DUF6429)